MRRIIFSFFFRRVLPILLLWIFFLSSRPVWSQQGSSCQSAIPLTIPFNVTSVNSCSFANNYTGQNGCLPLVSLNPYAGKDVYFSFVPTQSGYINIQLYGVIGDGNIRPRLYLFKGCPDADGKCVNVLLGNTNPDGTSVILQVYEGVPYFIIVDAATTQPGLSDCFRFSLKSTFQPVPSVPGCTNMDFNDGNLNGWTGTTGRSVSSPVGSPTPNYVISAINILNNRQTIVSGGVDPCGGFPQVDPLGEPYSLLLGNNKTGAQGEQISQTFRVTEQNSSLTYRYAVVFQDPHHPATNQPFFRAIVKGDEGDVVPCSDFIVSAAGNLPGFFDGSGLGCGSVRYKPWSTVNVDLSIFAGKEVTVEFTIGDCTQGGHYGYAYIDAFCSPSTLNALGDTICLGDSVHMAAPDGYSSYRWLPMDIYAQSITVSPDTSTMYTLELTAFNGCKSTYEIPIVVTNPPQVSFIAEPDNCDTPVNFIETGTVNIGSLKSEWIFGPQAQPIYAVGSPASALFLGEGSYPVKLIQTTAGGCVDSVTQNVDVPVCFYQVRLEGDTICPGACYTIPSTIHYGTRPFSYLWSDGSTDSTLTVCPLQTTSYHLKVTDAIGLIDTDTVEIMVSPPAIFDPIVRNISCHGLTDGLIEPRPEGFGPFAFRWSNDSTYAKRDSLVAGDYLLEVIDKFACITPKTFHITEPDTIAAFISLIEPTCNTNTGSILIDSVAGGTPGFRYGTGNGIVDVSSRFDLLAEGNYNILVRDTNGCENRFMISLRNTTAPQAIDFSQVNAICNTSNGEIMINGITGGLAPFTYEFSGGGFQDIAAFPMQIQNLEGIPYTLRVKDAGNCFLDTLISLAEPGSPESLIAQATSTSCGESNGSVTLFLTGGTLPIQYSLNGVDYQTDSIFANIPSGAYLAMIRDSNNCILQKAVQVDSSNGMEARININTPVKCYNDSTAVLEASAGGGIPPYHIEWNNGTDGEILSDMPSGFYQLKVTDADGCEALDSIDLVNPRPISAQIVGLDSLCLGDSLRLSSWVRAAQGNVQYNWQQALSIDSVLNWIPLSSGTIELIVTDGQGCSDTTEKTIVLLPLPSGTLVVDTAEACEPLCVAYSFLQATTIPLIDYVWNSPEGETSSQDFLKVCYPVSGFYGVNLMLTDTFGCKALFHGDSLVRVNPLPFSDFSVEPEKTDILRPEIITEQLSLDAEFFSWTFGDGDTSSLEAPGHIYRDTGFFEICLRVSTQFNCIDDTCKTVEIDAFPTFYAPNTFTPDGNGINDTFFLFSTYEITFQLQIFNRWGEPVFYSEDAHVGWDGTYLGKPVQSDVYSWKATFINIFKEEFVLYGRVLLLR